MSTLRTMAVRFRPLSGLHLRGAGGRAALEPAPGTVTREEPLLPRLETLLGVLASHWWETRGGSCRGDWWSCAAIPAARLVCGDADEAVFVGPLLRVETQGGGRRVYINAATALVEAERLNDYYTAALYAAEAAETLNPRRRAELLAQAASAIEELEAAGSLIPGARILRRWTGIALNPGRGSVEHGHLYTRPRIDYHTWIAGEPVTHAEIILLTCCSSADRDNGEAETWVTGIGPRSPPTRATIEPLSTSNQCTAEHAASESPRIALTPTPLSIDEAAAPGLRILHPLRPPPPLELLAAVYNTAAAKGQARTMRKTRPRPALWPGTIILENNNAILDPESSENNNYWAKVRLLRAPALATLLDTLRTLDQG